MTIQLKDKIFFCDKNNRIKYVDILQSSESLLRLDCKDTIIYENNNLTCKRGYLAKYDIVNNKLVLNELQVDNNYNISIISNNSIKVSSKNSIDCISKSNNLIYNLDESQLFKEKYTNINLPISYDGTLIVGYKKNHNSIFSNNDNMSYWINRYRYILELTLSKGYLEDFKIIDKSILENSSKHNFFNLVKVRNFF